MCAGPKRGAPPRPHRLLSASVSYECDQQEAQAARRRHGEGQLRSRQPAGLAHLPADEKSRTALLTASVRSSATEVSTPTRASRKRNSSGTPEAATKGQPSATIRRRSSRWRARSARGLRASDPVHVGLGSPVDGQGARRMTATRASREILRGCGERRASDDRAVRCAARRRCHIRRHRLVRREIALHPVSLSARNAWRLPPPLSRTLSSGTPPPHRTPA